MSKSAEKQKRSYASNATAFALFAIGAVVVVNLISTRVFGRIDLTEARIYTLSAASKDIVKNLPDRMTIKAFISAKDLPPELTSVSRYVRDLIDEYKTHSEGKLTWEAIDPGADKKLEEEASRCKVRKLQIQVMRAQKFELGSHYMGLCFEYNGQIESIPEVARPEGLEYQVSSLIKRMTQKKRKVAFTTGKGELDLSQGFQALKQAISQEYEATTVDPGTAEIGDDVDALVVGGPKQAMDEKARRAIDAFLMKGKGAVILVDGMAMNTPRGANPEQMDMMPKIAQANETGLGDLLAAYGFKVGQDFVLDTQNLPGPVDMGGRRMLANMPVFVGAETETHKDLSILAGVKAAVFPFASTVELVGPLQGGKSEKGKLWRLAASSPTSWKHTGFFFFSPSMKLEESKDKGPFAFGYAYQGPLKSAFAPAAPAGMSTPDAAAPSESKKPVRLMVMGDSDFASDEFVQLARFLPIYASGAQLLFNAVSWTLEDEALTPARSKTVTSRPIQVSSDEQVTGLKLVNVAGVPLAFCAFGIVRWRLARARRRGQQL